MDQSPSSFKPRTDRTSLGCGGRVAAFVNGSVYYGTSDLGPILNTLSGAVSEWSPALVRYAPPDAASPVREQRVALVTDDDVLCVRHELVNETDRSVRHELVVAGDCRSSHDFRDAPRPEAKTTELLPGSGRVVIADRNACPGAIDALFLAVGASPPPTDVSSAAPGTYRLRFLITLAPREHSAVTVAIALDPRREVALDHLATTLAEPDLLARQAAGWTQFFAAAVPTFESADQRLVELYRLRWYLLRFATLRGGLGAFKDSVVLEGRSAYQVYCCFSAPFMALDLRWARDPAWCEQHIGQMLRVQYQDGRFPWYATPRTAQVPVHHASATGLSFLVSTGWDAYLVHHDRAFLERVYDGFLRNLRWWTSAREPARQPGLFLVEHMLETGMDDSPRGDGEPFAKLMPLLAVDLGSYLFRDARALAAMARTLGKPEAPELDRLAARIEKSVLDQLWDAQDRFFYDRSQNGDWARVRTPAGFYPYFAGLGDQQHLALFEHLLDSAEFLAPFPVPSVALNEPCFDRRSYWKGPSWPATSCHVVQAFAAAAKAYRPQWREPARALLDRCLAVLFTPQVDFHMNSYDPIDGTPLSTFKDYLHSWWIDLIVQHVVGLVPRADRVIELDPLPPTEAWFRMRGIRYHGHDLGITWRRASSWRAGRPVAGLSPRGGWTRGVRGGSARPRADRRTAPVSAATAPVFHVALLHPEIPHNTGNIARLCVTTLCRLHIVGRAGFSLDAADVRRAGLYFWRHLDLRTWRDHATFLAAHGAHRVFYFSRKGSCAYTDLAFEQGDVLAFGRESRGLDGLVPREVVASALTIPLIGPARSLNLANAVAAVVLEGLRQLRARGVALPEAAALQDDASESFDLRPQRPSRGSGS
ncbi:MAG: TrmH family RNA methyltransferase [Planctomycetota bacterium]